MTNKQYNLNHPGFLRHQDETGLPFHPGTLSRLQALTFGRVALHSILQKPHEKFLATLVEAYVDDLLRSPRGSRKQVYTGVVPAAVHLN